MAALPYPHPTSADVTKRMRRNPRRDTGPERALRSALHLRGLRFRKALPIRAPSRVVRPDVARIEAALRSQRQPLAGAEPGQLGG